MARHLYATRAVLPGIRATAHEPEGIARPPLASVQRWTLRAGLFLLPLVYSPVTYDQWVLPKLLFARALVLVLLTLFGLRALHERTITIKHTPLDAPLIALLASATISTLFATNLNVAIFGIYFRYDGLLTLVTYAGLYWLAVQTIDGPSDAWALLRTLLASAYVVSAIAILQVAVSSFSSTGIWLQLTDAVQGSIVRAYGTLGQWNVLGEFLVLAWPLALWELLRAKSRLGRMLALNAVVVIGMALALTFSRSTWAAVLLASAVVLVGPWASLGRRVLVGAFAVAIVGVVGVVFAFAGGLQFETAIAAHAATYLHPGQWDGRLLYWRDTMHLIASRPLFGYGPDNFGLAFPKFESFFSPVQVDKAHAETLQVAATQGIVGLAAYLWLIGSFAFGFWRGRRMPGASAIFAGWLGYQTILQVNFTALGSALPYWIFMAAALHSFGLVAEGRAFPLTTPLRFVVHAAAVPVAALAVIGVVFPLLADSLLLSAVQSDRAGDGAAAASAASRAEILVPTESIYAVEVGNVAYERGSWAHARAAYTVAARLGTYNPMVYRNLAYADRNLGLETAARAAALDSYELDRFDPVNQAVLAQFGEWRA